MEKHLIFLSIIIIFIVIYCLFYNQMKETETFTTVTPTGIDDDNAIDTLGAFASDYLTSRTQSNSTLILGNVNLKNRHVLVSDNDGWLRLKSKTDLSQNSNLFVKDFNVDGSFNLLPSGMIFAWSGTVVPTGWVVCDGTYPTPDLRGRFILGQGQGNGLTNRVLGDRDGRADITLTMNEIPNHSHTFKQPNETVVRNDHNDILDIGNPEPRGKANSYKWTTPNTNSYPTPTGNNVPLSFNNMPPYYVLAYIMKL